MREDVVCTGLKGEIRRVGLGRAGGEAAGEGLGKEMRWQWGKQAEIGRAETKPESMQLARPGHPKPCRSKACLEVCSKRRALA